LEKVKVGVVGTGHLGRFHALNYKKIAGADLLGVYDQDMEKAVAVAKECKCDHFNTIKELLDKVQAVSIAVPTDRHHAVGTQALKHGIHCIIEKPIAKDVKEANDLIRLAKENNIFLQVGHIERFNPAIRALEDIELNPQFIESHRLAPFNPRGTEVAVVLDLMIHDIDIILSLVKSPVQSVDASGVAVVSDSIDISNARIRFDNGCVANLTASRISQKKMRKMRMFQKDTYISVDFLEKKSEVYQLVQGDPQSGHTLGEIGVGDKKRHVVYQKPKPPKSEGLEKELELFLDSIRTGRPNGVSGEAGRDALTVAMRVLEQMES
jgi:predicted dehydrogenase